jgi:carbon-monoxide dehydrogenase small subunit
MKTEISFSLNGSSVTAVVKGGDLLIDLLRSRLGLTGTKEGCGRGQCGSCTVIVDGRAVNSCIYPAMEIEGRGVVTIEGLLGPGNELSSLQRAFVEHGGIQCGFCTPGMILSAKALLDRNPDPSEDEIREALGGNLCRCTGYVQIVESVKRAAEAARAGAGRGGSR